VTVDSAVDRDRIIVELRRRGIGSNIGTYSLNGQGIYADARQDCPNSVALFQRHLALPMFPGLRDDDQERVVNELERALLAG
jgi:perosamine synthetase